METVTRKYTIKDVDMLVTSSTIVESAIANKAVLQSKRSIWADPFFDNIKKKIETATQTHLGVDSAKELRGATQAVLGIQKQATKDLALCKVQIDEDFKSDKPRRTEILKQLGFTSFLKAAQNDDQEAMIQLLFQFKKNLDNNLKTEIMAKGTAKETLDNIVTYAHGLINANVTQEGFKSSRKKLTAAAINAFNEIYDQIISISKIAAKFFLEDPSTKDQFSFSKVSKALNNLKGAEPPKKP